MDEPTIIDLFSGAGGMHLGFTRAGFRCLWANDFDAHAHAIYRYRFPETPHSSADIKDIDARDIPDHTVLCAGFPCQPFSTAGEGRGLEDSRGDLFFEVARIARIKRTPVLFLENVRGLLSNNRGAAFRQVLESLDELGYHVEWQLLNSLSFGVPQSRPRVYIIGYLGKRPARAVFPVGDADGVAEKGFEVQEEPHLNYIDANYRKGIDKHGQRTVIASSSSKAVAVDGRSAKLREAKEEEHLGALRRNGVSWGASFAVSFTNPHEANEERLMNVGDSVRSLNVFGGNQQPFIVSPPHGNYKGGDKDVPNLRSNSGAQYNEVLCENQEYRRLTPLECERAQSFPDNWTEFGIYPAGALVWTGKYKVGERKVIDEDGVECILKTWRPIMMKAKEEGVYRVTDSQRYIRMGEAVTVNIIEFLANRLRRVLDDSPRT